MTLRLSTRDARTVLIVVQYRSNGSFKRLVGAVVRGFNGAEKERRGALRVCAFLSALACVFAVPRIASAACDDVAPWSRLPQTGKSYLTPLPLSLTALAIAAPAAMAPTGVDHQLRLVSQEDLGGRPNSAPVAIATPYVLGGALFFTDAFALGFHDCGIARPTSAMLQAMALTVATVGAMKWVTSRTWPNGGEPVDAPDRLDHPERAKEFNWFDWNKGNAWPSGHTSTMFAAAAALGTVTYHRHWTGYVAYAAATGVAAAMWLGDYHWASDIVSGGLYGFAVGRSVGLAFRPGLNEPTSALLLPLTTPSTTGLQVVGTF